MSINTSYLMNKRSRRNSRGFTLLEALIGFLILSIGMLGIASLQAISLKAGKTSIYGSVAIMKVEELFESMRANPSALATYEGAGSFKDCANVACDAAMLAQEDVFLWKQDLTVGLPAAVTTSVTVTAATPPSKMATVNIDIGWKERDKSSTASVDRTYSTAANICTQIPC